MNHQNRQSTSGLTNEDVILIQALWNEKPEIRAKRDYHRKAALRLTRDLSQMTSKALARKFEVTPATINHATTKHVAR